MEMSTPVYPASLPIGGGYGNYGMGAGGVLGGSAIGLILGSLLSGNGLGLGGNNLNTAINANQSGEIAGLQAGLANVQSNQSSDRVLGTIDRMEADLSGQLRSDIIAVQAGQADTNNNIASLATAQANDRYTNLVNTNGLGRDIIASNTQALIQALNTANLTNSLISGGFNEVGRDMATATNQLIMGQNAMSAQMAMCCCNIEKNILSDGAMTRALITQNRMDDLQAQLNDAKNSISNSNQTNALAALMAQQTNTILSHIPVLLGARTTVTV